ncbi:RHS repeat-associated core domain-containing protein [Thiovibrio sp. JS02]
MQHHGNEVKQPYAYTAREWDQETGLYFYRARYYDPQVGRFISKDPIGFEGGVNAYAYVKGNPVNAVDPRGLKDTVTEYWEKTCGKLPSARDRCECRCQIATDFNGCLERCTDCFSSSKLSSKDLCMCQCKALGGNENCECVCGGK